MHIPTLCYHRDLAPEGHCRVCLVEVEGQRTLQPACIFPVADGMVVKTNSARSAQGRKFSVELLLSNHPNECLTCTRNQNCELQKLAQEMGITERRFEGERTGHPIDDSSLRHPRQREVHALPPLRAGLPAGAERRRAGRVRARVGVDDRPRLRARTGGEWTA